MRAVQSTEYALPKEGKETYILRISCAAISVSFMFDFVRKTLDRSDGQIEDGS